MEIIIKVPDLESLPLIEVEEKKPVLVDTNNGKNGKVWRIVNLKIPKKEGIYFLYDKSKELIYIGEANNLMQRISCHRTLRDIFYVKFFLTNYTMRKRIGVEQLLINKYKPKEQQNTTRKLLPYT